jgi:biopolymer transport protein ExbD
MYAEDPTGTVVIQADDESNLETLSEVTKAARDIGIADVAVATERK